MIYFIKDKLEDLGYWISDKFPSDTNNLAALALGSAILILALVQFGA